MNNAILQKCLAELEKGEPRLDYVRGMLETLIALDEGRVSWRLPIEEVKKWAGSTGTNEIEMREDVLVGENKKPLFPPVELIEGLPPMSPAMVAQVKQKAQASIDTA